jgi:hypothetical protein
VRFLQTGKSSRRVEKRSLYIYTAVSYVHSTVLWTHIDVGGTEAWIEWIGSCNANQHWRMGTLDPTLFIVNLASRESMALGSP